jgi:hypothetical protein
VAIHPENYGGKQMKATDILSFGMPLLVGFSLLYRFFKRTSLPRMMFRVPDKVIEVHQQAHSKLIGGKSFPIPGGMLVTSLRGWMAGEIVWISFLSIREQAKKKLENVRSALPVASFLFSLLLEAGMGSHSALQEVSQAIPKGPLARELEEISRARMLGISREEALERSRGRVPLDDYQIFLNLIRQGERLGVGLSRGLREHSSKMLEGEGYRAEAAAQKAAVKLLFPLVAFIFPAVVLVIFSPIILNIMEMWGH